MNLGFDSVYLNSDYLNIDSSDVTLSKPSPLKMPSVDFDVLLATLIELIRRFNSQLPTLERLQEQ